MDGEKLSWVGQSVGDVHSFCFLCGFELSMPDMSDVIIHSSLKPRARRWLKLKIAGKGGRNRQLRILSVGWRGN